MRCIHSDARHLTALTDVWLQNATWREQYVAGFISWSGSFGGRGANYANLFSGLNLADGSYDPSSASAWASFPGTFLGAAAPDAGEGPPVIATSGAGESLSQHTGQLEGLVEQLRHRLSMSAQPLAACSDAGDLCICLHGMASKLAVASCVPV